MSSSSEEDGPQPFVAKRRIRHINTILVHNLTLTPHRDELLSSDVPVSTNAGEQDEERSLSSSAGRRRIAATVDDLELLGVGTGRRRRRVSISSFQSVKEVPSPPLGSPTSPSIPTSFAFPHPPPSTSGGSPTIRRPSLSRARASSRLSSSYNIPPSFDFDSAASLLAPSPTAPVGSRARSSSRTSIGSTGSDLHQSGRAGGIGEVVIKEDVEQELPTPGIGSGLALEDEGSPLDAAKRLLESFITLRLSDETAESFSPSNEAGPSSSSSSASSSSLAKPSTSLRLVPSSSSDLKGKGRAISSPPSLAKLPSDSPSPPSSGSSSRPSHSSTSSSQKSTPSSSRPTTPPTPRPSSPNGSLSPGPPSTNSKPPSLPSRVSSTSTSTVRPRNPSANPTSTSSTLRNPIKSRPRPNSLHDASSSPSNSNSSRPFLSRSATSSLRVPSSPSTPRPILSSDAEHTPFYISSTHQPSTHPRFGDLDAEADFGKWDRRIWREEKVVVEVWVAAQKRSKGTAEKEEEDGKEKDWKVLKEVEIDLGRVRRWNGKSFLPPNTVLISFTSHPLDFYFVPPAPPPSLVRPSLERHLSDGEIEAPRSSPFPKRRKRVAEWGDVGDAVERSLRETRMKKGIGFGELHRLVNLQTVLQDTQESSKKIEAGLDRLIEEDETAVLLRLISEEEARIRGVQEADDALQLETQTTQQHIADLEVDLVRRKGNLDRGEVFLSSKRTELQEMERALEVEKSTRHALDPHFHSQRARLSEALENIFQITPTIHGRSLLFSINNVALPIPTHPKEPAPPLHLPPSELPPNIHVDEDSVATALGYAAMVVQHLAGYMGKSLPYPIISSQSRSLVKDPISVLHGPTRLFPLYSKGVEKYRFEYAVYLLNKDIESLMIDRAIRIMDLRHTLPNLMNLLLTVSSEWPSNLPIEPRSRHVSHDTAYITTVVAPVRLDDSEVSLDPSDSEDEDADRGGQTPKASEPSALSIFWGLGGGGGGKSAAEKKVDQETKPRSRRGTIARAFGGAGESKVATPTKEMPSGGGSGGRGAVPELVGTTHSPRAS